MKVAPIAVSERRKTPSSLGRSRDAKQPNEEITALSEDEPLRSLPPQGSMSACKVMIEAVVEISRGIAPMGVKRRRLLQIFGHSRKLVRRSG